MRFEKIYGRFTEKELSGEEVADILGISTRTFLRKRRRYESEEFAGTIACQSVYGEYSEFILEFPKIWT